MFHGPMRWQTHHRSDRVAGFSWEDVKADRYREYYLGHSVKAPVGRWQKGKDLTWYAKTKEEREADRRTELEAVRAAEERAMASALCVRRGRACVPPVCHSAFELAPTAPRTPAPPRARAVG